MKSWQHRQKRETKSPLKDLPVRNPAQGLDEEIDRLLNDRAAGYMLVMAMVALLVWWEWWRWVFNLPPHPILFTVLGAGVFAFYIPKLVGIRRQLRNLALAVKGEKAVGQYLEEHARPLGYQVLHDVVGDGFNVDHVLVGPGGVFAVETKTISKPAKGISSVRYDGETVTVDGFRPDRDPVAQARACAGWIRDIVLKSSGRTVPVRPIVLYPGWFVEKMPKGVEVWVLNEKAIVSFLSQEDRRLPDEDIALITHCLKRHVIMSEQHRK